MRTSLLFTGLVEQYWFAVGLSLSCRHCSNAGQQWTTEVLCWSYWQGIGTLNRLILFLRCLTLCNILTVQILVNSWQF